MIKFTANSTVNKLLNKIALDIKKFINHSCSDKCDSEKLVESVINDIGECIEKQEKHINTLNEIGMALSSENNLDKLLEMILSEAKKFTNTDGGTLYLVSKDEEFLNFKVVITDSLNIKMGGTEGEIKWPALKLHKEDGSQNREMVAALSALEKRIIDIPDVYEADGFNFEGTKRFDASTGYRSQSMLVIPMLNYEKEVIGVLQLINKKDTVSGKTIAFNIDDELSTMSLASQAAVAITNTQLVLDLQNLLESVVKSIAVAVDEKSPYTGGHVRRVAALAMLVAKAISETSSGRYKDITYDNDQLREIYMSAWMHDVGKVTTPEHIVDKSTKLSTIYDRIHNIATKFEVAKRDAEINYLKSIASGIDERKKIELKKYFLNSIKQLDNDFEFLKTVNIGGEFMSDDKIERVKRISQIKLIQNGVVSYLLNEDEVKNLCIKKGTLTEDERQKINDHAIVSFKMLSALPFPKKLSKIPEIAGAHHEKLNGKGYPRGLTAEQISLEGRIMALADIFEALTAADRPYKPAKTLNECKKIIDFMIKDGELDGDLVEFFYDNGLDMEYAKKELKPEQYKSDI